MEFFYSDKGNLRFFMTVPMLLRWDGFLNLEYIYLKIIQVLSEYIKLVNIVCYTFKG